MNDQLIKKLTIKLLADYSDELSNKVCDEIDLTSFLTEKERLEVVDSIREWVDDDYDADGDYHTVVQGWVLTKMLADTIQGAT